MLNYMGLKFSVMIIGVISGVMVKSIDSVFMK